jgi:hypothetical protein
MTHQLQGDSDVPLVFKGQFLIPIPADIRSHGINLGNHLPHHFKIEMKKGAP